MIYNNNKKPNGWGSYEIFYTYNLILITPIIFYTFLYSIFTGDRIGMMVKTESFSHLAYNVIYGMLAQAAWAVIYTKSILPFLMDQVFVRVKTTIYKLIYYRGITEEVSVIEEILYSVIAVLIYMAFILMFLNTHLKYTKWGDALGKFIMGMDERAFG